MHDEATQDKWNQFRDKIMRINSYAIVAVNSYMIVSKNVQLWYSQICNFPAEFSCRYNLLVYSEANYISSTVLNLHFIDKFSTPH